MKITFLATFILNHNRLKIEHNTITYRYHEWMKNEELLELTASEPLTLEEEYEMQRSWYEDNDSKYFTHLL